MNIFLARVISFMHEYNRVITSITNYNQCTRSSSFPCLDSIMVIFTKWATPGEWYTVSLSYLVIWCERTVANSIVPLPHFVRRGTIKSNKGPFNDYNVRGLANCKFQYGPVMCESGHLESKSESSPKYLESGFWFAHHWYHVVNVSLVSL